MAAPPSFPGSASECRQGLRSPHSLRPACGWSSAENPAGTQKVVQSLKSKHSSAQPAVAPNSLRLCHKLERPLWFQRRWSVCVHWHSLSRLGCVLNAASREGEKGHVRGGRMRIHNLITLLLATDQPTWRELDPHWVHDHTDYSSDGSLLCSVGIQAGYSAVNEPVHTEGLLHAGEDELRPPVSH